jgi:hypothetical protein
VHGKFGFDDWTGPRFHLHSEQNGKWTLAPGDQSALVVGRDDTLHFTGDSTLCVDSVEEQAANGSPVKLTFKTTKPDTLEVSVPMKEGAPGPVTLQIWQYGQQKPDSVKVDAYAEAASLDRLTLSSGDADATLTGTRLDEVAQVTMKGIDLDTWDVRPRGGVRPSCIEELPTRPQGWNLAKRMRPKLNCGTGGC